MFPRLIVILLAVTVTACAAEAPAAEPTSNPVVSDATEAAPPAAPVTEINTDNTGLAARVNGAGIPIEAFERAVVRSQQQIMAASPEALRATVLDTMIEQMLIEQEAERMGISISQADIDAEFAATRALVEDDATWQAWLEQNMFTEQEFRESLRATLIAAAVRDQVVDELPEQVLQTHARHILVDTEAEAQDILQRLQNGEDFATLAASHSKDITTRDQGGDLGWFAEGELLEPALTQAAFILTAGQIGGPVPTRLGYHIIQSIESAERPLEPERRALLAQLQFENWVRGLQFNAVVERYQ